MTVLALILLTVVVGAFGFLPAAIVASSPAARSLPLSDQFKAETDVRSALLQAVAGTLLVVGAVTAWRQFLVSRNQYYLSRRVASTEAFNKCVELLSSPEEPIRLGAIYGLDRVARDAPDEEERISRLMSAYIKQYPDRRSEITTAVQILAGRQWSGVLNLAGVDLSDAELLSARLRNAELSDVNLNNANLTQADFGGAVLKRADMRRAQLHGSNLTGADLTNARLSGAQANRLTRWPIGFELDNSGVILE